MAGSDSIWVAITPKRDWVVFSLDREQEVDFTRARVHLGALTQELAWVDSSEVITETLEEVCTRELVSETEDRKLRLAWEGCWTEAEGRADPPEVVSSLERPLALEVSV